VRRFRRLSFKEEKALATATQSAEYEDKAVGWLVFAASMLGLAGFLSIIDGIMALSRSKFFVANATYTFSDLRTWGWITLIIGVLLIVAAMGVLSGSQFARWFGIIMAGLNALGFFASVQAYPFWALMVFAIDVLVIYALATYGGVRRDTA
jgi:hypothetical protein